MCYVMDFLEIGKRIKELRKQRGMTQEALAEAIGKSRNYVAMIEAGERQGKFVLQQIADALQVEIEVLEGDKPIPEHKPKEKPLKSFVREFERRYDNLNMRELPILCHVPCNYPMPNEQEAEGYLSVFKEDLGYARDKSGLFVLIASGECLSGDGIHDGYKLVVDPEPLDHPEGAIYAVRIGSEVTCKHVYHLNEKVKLAPSNSEYKELIYNADDVEIKGMVILSGNWKRHHK